MENKAGKKEEPRKKEEGPRSKVWWLGPGDMIVDGKKLSRKSPSMVPDQLIELYPGSFTDKDPNAQVESKEAQASSDQAQEQEAEARQDPGNPEGQPDDP